MFTKIRETYTALTAEPLHVYTRRTTEQLTPQKARARKYRIIAQLCVSVLFMFPKLPFTGLNPFFGHKVKETVATLRKAH